MPLDVWAATLPIAPPTLQPAPPPPPPGSGSVLTTFQLVSPNTGPAEFSVGVPLKKGLSSGALSTSVTNSQATVKRGWNDNSDKHVLIDGIANLTANVPLTVQVLDTPGVGGTILTSGNIAANSSLQIAGQNVINLGVNGSVDLSSLLGSPVRTWRSGPLAVECHYQQVVTVGTSAIYAAFHVRLYQSGRIWIRAIVENGWVGLPNADKAYVATITIGGVVIFTQSLTHYQHTRWFAEGWVGGDPQVTPAHNITDLIATKLVPNYFMDTPQAAMLSGTDVAWWGDWKATQTYTPMGSADLHPSMGDTGPQDQIGILPLWDSLYVTSLADPRMFRCLIANALSVNSYGIVWRGATDNNLPGRPSIWTNYAFDGSNGQNAVPGGGGAGTQQPVEGTLIWDAAHHPSAGYLAYLLTGDYAHLETMQHQCSALYFNCTSLNGSGVNRDLKTGAVRQWGWATRTIGQMVALCPTTDLVAVDYAALLSNNAAINNSVITTTPGLSNLGIIYEYDAVQTPIAPGQISPLFMFFFVCQALGHVSDIEPLADMTTFNAVRDFNYKIPIGLLGTASGTDYYYTYAAADFRLNAYSSQPTTELQAITSPPLDSTWGGVWNRSQATHTQPGTVLDNTVHGSSGSAPVTGATSFWANLMPAIAYAVDHGSPGAAACWSRLIGTSNWLTLRNATDIVGTGRSFANSPIFGIQPRDALRALLTDMAAGTWASVNQPLNSVVYGNLAGDSATIAANIHGNTGPSAITSAWGGACFDTTGNRLIIWGGGHLDYFGNEVYAFNCATLTWSRLTTPFDVGAAFSGSVSSSATSGTYAVGQPASRHTYDGLVYLPSTNTMRSVGGAGSNTGTAGGTIVWDFNLSTLAWTQQGNYNTTSQQSIAHLDPTSGLLYAAPHDGDFQYLNGSVWTNIDQSTGYTVGAPTGVIKPSDRMFVIGNGGCLTANLSTTPVSGGAYTSHITTGDQTIQTTPFPGLAWHPGSGKIVAWNGNGAGAGSANLWMLDPATFAWTVHAPNIANTVTPTAPASNSSGPTTLGRWQYIASYNCFILVNAITDPVFIYKPDF